MMACGDGSKCTSAGPGCEYTRGEAIIPPEEARFSQSAITVLPRPAGHSRRLRCENLPIHHARLRTARLHIDRVRNGAEHVHVHVAATMRSEAQAGGVGDGRNLEPFGYPARAPIIRLYNVRAAPLDEWTTFRLTGEALDRLANEEVKDGVRRR